MQSAGSASSDQRLSYHPSAAGDARRFLTDLLAKLPLASPGNLAADSSLVVHELVLNAVTHGEPDGDGGIGLSLRVDGRELVISVHDGGSEGTVAPLPSSTSREHGRGLAMVAALSSRWSVDRSAGTTVTAWLALDH